jgi:hypothetical protein
VIAAGAGHEIGKHRLLSDGVCAPGAEGRRRKAKNDCAAGQKKLKKEEGSEVRGDCVIRNQNKSTSKSRISSNTGNQSGFVFGAFVPLGRGEMPQGKKWLPQAKIWESMR